MLDGRIVGTRDIVKGGSPGAVLVEVVGSKLENVDTSMISVLVDEFSGITDEDVGIESVNLGVASGVEEGRGIILELVRENLEIDEGNSSLCVVLGAAGVWTEIVSTDAVVESGPGT